MSAGQAQLPDDFLPGAQLTRALEITVPRDPFIANFGHKFVNFGSCFAQNIKRILDDFGFESFFVSESCAHYCTESLAATLESTAAGGEPGADNFLEIDGKVYAYRHHLKTPFLGPSAREDALARVRGLGATLRLAVREADTFIFTLGTSRVIRLRANGQPIIVAAGLGKEHWDLEMLDAAQSAAYLRRACAAIMAMRRGRPANLVITVSPQRYLFSNLLDEGTGLALVDNFISKCNLRVAVETLLADPPEGFALRYFPAFEIVYEELRQFETLAHYDYCHISQENTPDLVVKKFLLAHAAQGVLEQLSAATRVHEAWGKIARLRSAGAPAGDPQVVALIDDIETALARFGDELSAPLLGIRFNLAAQYGRALPKMFREYPYHRSDNLLADALIFIQRGEIAMARSIAAQVMQRIGPRRSADPDAGVVIEHLMYNEASRILNSLPVIA